MVNLRVIFYQTVFLFCCLLTCISESKAIDYTFTGTGMYNDASLWSPSYPGGIVDADDHVIITAGSECTLPIGTLLLVFGTVTNNGELIAFNNWGCHSDGLLINNGFILSYGIIDNLGSITNNGEIVAEHNFSCQGSGDILNNEDGTITINQIFIATTINGGSYSFDGAFSGEGDVIVEDYTNNGTIRPGFSPGILTFNNNLILASAGNLEIEIAGNGGAGASNGHDQIIVEAPGPTAGDLDVDGALDVSLLNGFTPQPGDEWIIATGITSGSFATTNLPAGYNWEVDIQSDQIVLRMIETVLPVELVNFKGQQFEDQVYLAWETSSEINNDTWVIQRLTEYNDWKEIGELSGAGNSLVTQQYRFADQNPIPGTNYYRLVQFDFDGRSAISHVVPINFKPQNKAIEIFPNPSSGIVHLSGLPKEVQIFNSSGKLVFQAEGPGQTLSLESLPAGLYNVKLIEASKFKIERLLIRPSF